MEILELIKLPLSDEQVSILLNGDVTIIRYRDLYNYKTVNQLFNESNNVIILYETSSRVGHWIAIINNDNYVEFFDSYGYKPDHEKEMIQSDFLKSSGQINNYVIHLLRGTNKKVIYNEKQLQQSNNNVSTCGRHCIVRIIMKDMPLKTYQKILLKYGVAFSDYYVTYFLTLL